MTTPASARQYRVLGKPDMIAAARDIRADANQLGVKEQAELVMNALADVGWQLDHIGFDPNGLPTTLVLSRTPSDTPEGA